VIEKLIEDWWTSSTERVYQQPFAALLVAQGHRVVHVTRHCGMELGKDLISIDPDGMVHAFQLKTCKGARFSLSEWQKDISSQLADLVESPCIHASFGTSENHQPWLVVNGGVEEEVTRAIEDRNVEYLRRFGRQLKIKVLGDLVKETLDYKEAIWATTPQHIKLLLEAYLENGKRNFDKDRFSKLLSFLFEPSNVGHEKSDLRRRITLAPILTTFALRNHSAEQNWCAEIDALTICWSYIHAAELKVGLPSSETRKTKDAVFCLIVRAMEGLYSEVKNNPTLFQEGFEYAYGWVRLRSIWVIGVLSALALHKRSVNSPDDQLEDLIDQVFQCEHTRPLIWGEAAVPQFLAFVLSSISKSAHLSKEAPLLRLCEAITTMNDINSKVAMATPYISPDQYLHHLRHPADPELQFDNAGYSWYLSSIIDIMTSLGWRQRLASQWDKISQIRSEWFECENEWEEYVWRAEKGVNLTVAFDVPQSWAKLCEDVKNLDDTKVDNHFGGSPALGLLYLMAFPHRVSRTLIRSIFVTSWQLGNKGCVD